MEQIDLVLLFKLFTVLVLVIVALLFAGDFRGGRPALQCIPPLRTTPLYFGKGAAGRRIYRVPSRIVWIRQVVHEAWSAPSAKPPGVPFQSKLLNFSRPEVVLSNRQSI